MSKRTTDDLIVMLARRARRARRRVREVEAYHRGLTEERDMAAEVARLAQELAAARLATQDADERAQARERQLVQARDALNATERAHGMASERVRELERERDAARPETLGLRRQRDEARAALADALTRAEAREEEIRRLSNRVEAAERARERDTEALVEAYEKAERERANEMRAVVVEHEAELQRLRREVEIRDGGIEMGVALVRWFACDDEDRESVGRYMAVTIMHRRDEDARAAHPLARGGA